MPRPTVGGAEIARQIAVGGRNVVLVAGPAGIGKSTELARATALLASERPTFLVQVDRHEDVRSLTVEALEGRVALAIGEQARARGANLSGGLRGVLAALAGSVDAGDPGSIVLEVVREVARELRGRPALLVDGLEKLPEGHGDRLAALAPLAADADLAVVVPWHAVYGPRAQEVVAPGERVVAIPPVSVAEVDFFRALLERRIGPVADAFVRDVVAPATVQSGGIPRTYLQLVADAAVLARLDRGADWPARRDVDLAARDHTDSFRRLLLPGDNDALLDAAGTDGRELELDRKLRFLVHGMLLVSEGLLRVHPLLAPVLVRDRHRRAAAP